MHLSRSLPVEQHPSIHHKSPSATFSQGIATIYSRPGRALRAWLRWIHSDGLQSKLVQLFREGVLNRPEETEDYNTNWLFPSGIQSSANQHWIQARSVLTCHRGGDRGTQRRGKLTLSQEEKTTMATKIEQPILATMKSRETTACPR